MILNQWDEDRIRRFVIAAIELYETANEEVMNRATQDIRPLDLAVAAFKGILYEVEEFNSNNNDGNWPDFKPT